MSQHRLKIEHQGHPIEVLMGWDRILSYYFLTVSRLDATKDEDDILYCNLDERDPYAKSLDPYLAKLQEMRITVPQSMIDEVRVDEARNQNRVVTHQADGSFVVHVLN